MTWWRVPGPATSTPGRTSGFAAAVNVGLGSHRPARCRRPAPQPRRRDRARGARAIASGAARRSRSSPVSPPPSTGPGSTKAARRCAGPSPPRPGRGPRPSGWVGSAGVGVRHRLGAPRPGRGAARRGRARRGVLPLRRGSRLGTTGHASGLDRVVLPRGAATHVGAATDHDPGRREVRFHAGVETYVRKWHGSIGLALLPGRHRAHRVAAGAWCPGRRAGAPRCDLARLYAVGARPPGPAAGHGPRSDRTTSRRSVPEGPDDRSPPAHVLLVDSSGYEDLGGASTVLDEHHRTRRPGAVRPRAGVLVPGAVARARAGERHRRLQLPEVEVCDRRATSMALVSGLRGVDPPRAGRAHPRQRELGTAVREPRRAHHEDAGHLAHPLPPAAPGPFRAGRRAACFGVVPPAHIVFTSTGRAPPDGALRQVSRGRSSCPASTSERVPRRRPGSGA